MLNFNATLVNSQVLLTWATASEINNDYFTVEKSRDGINFTEVASVYSAGNSSNSYEQYDINPYNGISYYRLKQTDLNGETSYSSIRTVNLNGTDGFSIYPNPTNGQFSIDLMNKQSNYSYKIYNMIGELVKTSVINNSNNQMDMTNLPAGQYMIQLTNTSSNENSFMRFSKF